MLERVSEVVADRELVEERQVPDVEIDRPEDQGHEWMRQHAQRPCGANVQQWLEHRAG